MSKTIIKVELSARGIQQAINEIKQYKQDIKNKSEKLRKLVATRLEEESRIGFAGAIVDDNIKGAGKRYADVDVSVDNRGSVTVVIASGEDAIWVEFGAGVYHNGSVGSSPNPHGAELGFTIGGFGKGNGKKEAWGYYPEDAERIRENLIITRGTPAKMPMTTAVTTVINEMPELVREVFG